MARAGVEVVVLEKHREFLNMLAEAPEPLPTFRLLRRHEVTCPGCVLEVSDRSLDGTPAVDATKH